MSEWKRRRDSSLPCQTWNPFPPEAIVHVKNMYGEGNIGPASTFWWGWERHDDGVIYSARRLDKPKTFIPRYKITVLFPDGSRQDLREKHGLPYSWVSEKDALAAIHPYAHRVTASQKRCREKKLLPLGETLRFSKM